MNYLFYGKDKGRIQKEINKIVAEYKDDCDIIQYDLVSSTINEVLMELNTKPFFYSHKIVIVKSCDFLGSAALNFDSTFFEAYLKNPVLENILVMVAEFEKVDSRKKITKLVQQTCRIINCAFLDIKDKSSYVNQKCKDLGIEIDMKTLGYLSDRLPVDTQIIDSQLEKLSCYPDELNEDIIDCLVLKPVEENIFLLSESVLTGKMNKAFHIYKDMVSLSYDPIYLIAVLGSQFRFYYQVKACMNQGMSEERIASYLKAHPYRVKLTCQIVRMIHIDKILKVLESCFQCDLDIKTGKREKYLAFEMFLIQCKENLI